MFEQILSVFELPLLERSLRACIRDRASAENWLRYSSRAASARSTAVSTLTPVTSA
ncbi:MAG: hypothetical protein OXH05_01195 [Acidobacteria bacterium]|nr:hypothetical protein [Acidobacteriota bacterium]